MAERKIPLRKCMACGMRREKPELLRFVRNDSGIFLDETGRADGRGAYVCRNGECLNLLVRKKGLERSYRMKVPEEKMKQLEKEVKDLLG